MFNLSIIGVEAHNDFTIDLMLSNGKKFIFDMKKYFQFPAFKKLQQLSFFKKVKFNGEVLYWDDMHDFPLHCMDIPQDILS
ncbi:MAG: hypothetical protein K0R14_437 [Burkholderiales bacterium]|jgi:hypothetical protein|nr:hypothetical protein [Burkholderiales bacterium]